MSKITTKDVENLTRASQTAHLLLADMRTVVSSESALLSDAVLELMEMASQVEKKLARLILAVAVEADNG
jgi:hypothetical protein